MIGSYKYHYKLHTIILIACNFPVCILPINIHKLLCFFPGTKLRPSSLTIKTKSRSTHSLNSIEVKESDFFALQATLQTEARMALAQAKELARIQMEVGTRISIFSYSILSHSWASPKVEKKTKKKIRSTFKFSAYSF